MTGEITDTLSLNPEIILVRYPEKWKFQELLLSEKKKKKDLAREGGKKYIKRSKAKAMNQDRVRGNYM